MPIIWTVVMASQMYTCDQTGYQYTSNAQNLLYDCYVSVRAIKSYTNIYVYFFWHQLKFNKCYM